MRALALAHVPTQMYFMRKFLSVIYATLFLVRDMKVRNKKN